jgi:endothelin-converting enzyme/putative endopeptidase
MSSSKTKKKSKDHEIPPFAKSIHPGTNFYGHINANWIRHVNMPTYASSYSVSEEIEDRITVNLENIVKNAQKAIVDTPNKELDQNTILLGTLMQSVIDKGSQEDNVTYLKNIVTNLRCIRGVEDVGSALGEFLKFRISTTLTVFTSSEERHSKNLRLIITTGNLGLPDTSYYTIQSPGRLLTLDIYNRLLVKLGDAFEVSNLNLYVGIEKILADALEYSRSDDEELIKGSDLRREYKYFPWDSFVKSAFDWEPSKFNSFSFLVVSKKWLEYMNRWFRTWSLDNWRCLLAGNILPHCIPFLPPPFNTWHFEFFGRRLRGQYEKLPRHLLGLSLCKQWLSSSLGKEFVSCCVDPQLKRYAIALAEEIVSASMKRLETIEWLEPSTRVEAIKKVKNIVLGIAYPDVFPKNPDVVLHPEKCIYNIFALGTADFKNDISRANKNLEPAHWTDSVFDVNAFYYNEGNRLIIPAGILQAPFFSIDATDGWNFGGIGATIGHELTHAFDMDGKNYDEFGNRNPWWTAKDNRNYNKKTKEIIALYNKTKYFNQQINGTLTLSENIADLGGLALSLFALKLRLEKKRVSQETRKQELCDFFTSYAVSWRTKEKRKKAIQSIFTDLHAPPPARVNNIVRHFDDWYECFDIKPGQLLYTSPEERIRIF